MGFLSNTQIWEDRWNCSDAVIHNASIAFKIQTFGRQSSWSRCREHQIWKLRASDQPLGRPSPWSGRVKP
jgi:hypothetical protein